MLPQMFYPVETEMTVRKGDTIAARCTMVNTRDRLVYIQGRRATTTIYKYQPDFCRTGSYICTVQP